MHLIYFDADRKLPCEAADLRLSPRKDLRLAQEFVL
jgi:hypothetical protein